MLEYLNVNQIIFITWFRYNSFNGANRALETLNKGSLQSAVDVFLNDNSVRVGSVRIFSIEAILRHK